MKQNIDYDNFRILVRELSTGELIILIEYMKDGKEVSIERTKSSRLITEIINNTIASTDKINEIDQSLTANFQDNGVIIFENYNKIKTRPELVKVNEKLNSQKSVGSTKEEPLKGVKNLKTTPKAEKVKKIRKHKGGKPIFNLLNGIKNIKTSIKNIAKTTIVRKSFPVILGGVISVLSIINLVPTMKKMEPITNINPKSKIENMVTEIKEVPKNFSSLIKEVENQLPGIINKKQSEEKPAPVTVLAEWTSPLIEKKETVTTEPIQKTNIKKETTNISLNTETVSNKDKKQVNDTVTNVYKVPQATTVLNSETAPSIEFDTEPTTTNTTILAEENYQTYQDNEQVVIAPLTIKSSDTNTEEEVSIDNTETVIKTPEVVNIDEILKAKKTIVAEVDVPLESQEVITATSNVESAPENKTEKEIKVINLDDPDIKEEKVASEAEVPLENQESLTETPVVESVSENQIEEDQTVVYFDDTNVEEEKEVSEEVPLKNQEVITDTPVVESVSENQTEEETIVSEITPLSLDTGETALLDTEGGNATNITVNSEEDNQNKQEANLVVEEVIVEDMAVSEVAPLENQETLTEAPTENQSEEIVEDQVTNFTCLAEVSAGKSYSVDHDTFIKLAAAIDLEGGGISPDERYTDRMAVISVILNRVENQDYCEEFGYGILDQLHAPGQFVVTTGSAYRNLCANPDQISPEAIQAATDVISGFRVVNKLSFGSKNSHYSKSGLERVQLVPNGNNYFQTQKINEVENVSTK